MSAIQQALLMTPPPSSSDPIVFVDGYVLWDNGAGGSFKSSSTTEILESVDDGAIWTTYASFGETLSTHPSFMLDNTYLYVFGRLSSTNKTKISFRSSPSVWTNANYGTHLGNGLVSSFAYGGGYYTTGMVGNFVTTRSVSFIGSPDKYNPDFGDQISSLSVGIVSVMCHGSSKFFASMQGGGSADGIYSSLNGKSWTLKLALTTSATQLYYNSGTMFMLCPDLGRVYYSTDEGDTWSFSSISLSAGDGAVMSFSVFDGTYKMIIRRSATGNVVSATSADGITWNISSTVQFTVGTGPLSIAINPDNGVILGGF